MLRANYHTHTSRCHHAGDFRDEEFVQAAVEAGYQILGFSDHTPWPYPASFVREKTNRMDLSELDGYLASVSALRGQYSAQLTMYVGLECEYFPRYEPFLQELRQRTDYLILGNHFRESEELGEPFFGKTQTPERLRQYVDYTVRGMETGLFACLAHPDFCLTSYPEFDDACRDAALELCRAAKALAVPLEYNLYGVDKRERGLFKGLGYPCSRFWETAAEVGCTAIIGVDAHKPDHIRAPEREQAACAYLERLGIPRLETLPGLE